MPLGLIEKLEASKDENMVDHILWLGGFDCRTCPFTDADALESMMMELDDMRNSVAVAVSIDILKTGNEEAKAALLEAMEERFEFDSEDDVDPPPPRTEAELTRWLEQNPDDEDDEDFYGPDKSDDDDD